MTNNKSNLSSNAKEAMHQFKMETAREVGVNLKEGYNGDLTSRQAGSIGGEGISADPFGGPFSRRALSLARRPQAADPDVCALSPSMLLSDSF